MDSSNESPSTQNIAKLTGEQTGQIHREHNIQLNHERTSRRSNNLGDLQTEDTYALFKLYSCTHELSE